jgi:gliding motility-associated-like protein
VFTTDTTTTFTVTGTNGAGCEGTDTVRVVVLPEPVFVMPNAFSPDGDGTNDVFNAVFEGDIFEQYSIAVYNRWGQKVFSSTRPSEGWNGKDAPSDVYVYVFDYLLIDGKTGQEKGEVTLIR